MKLPHLEDLPDLRSRRVLVRADLNVPLDQVDGRWVIADDFRIRSAIPTLRWLVDHGAEVVACSHLGRPSGSREVKYSMAPVIEEMKRLIPEVTVQENLRFNPGEEANSEEFVRELIDGFDYFVDDAFGCAHRRHASIVGPPKYLPSAAGRVMAEEVEMLAHLIEAPERPFVAVIGGSKVSDKLGLLRSMLNKVDSVLVGGGMCFTFMAALGVSVGDSLLEPNMIAQCKEMLESGKILIPSDVYALPIGESFGRCGGSMQPTIFEGTIPDGFRALDIGPKTVEEFSSVIGSAKTILWNGPMGVFEDERLARGTFAIAAVVAESSAYSVIGGGDSAAAIIEAGLDGAVTHLSTGGGASLEFLEKGDLPGIAALRESWHG